MPEEVKSSEQQDHKQGIFDERFQSLTNGFGEACEANNVNLAFAIAIHPDEDNPIVFWRGHKYDVATLLAYILGNFKREFKIELNAGEDI